MENIIALSADKLGYTVSLPGLTLAGCRISVQSDGAPVFATNLALAAEDGATVVRGETPLGPVAVRFAPVRDGAVALTATLDLAAPARRIVLKPLDGLDLADATHLLSHGRSMGGCKTCRLPAAKLEAENDEDPGAKFVRNSIASLWAFVPQRGKKKTVNGFRGSWKRRILRKHARGLARNQLAGTA